MKHFDALNGGVWTDDKNVVDCRVMKTYAAAPELAIQVRPLNGNDHG